MKNTHAPDIKIHTLQNHPLDVQADPLQASKIKASRSPRGEAGPKERHTR